jgi:carboxylesterase
MGNYFKKKGLTVYAPLLAGHGTTPEEMENTTWHDWWQSAVEGYERLKEYGCTEIYVAGLSMGGVLALRMAREKQVNGVISMSAPMRFRNKKAYFAWLLYRFSRYSMREETKAPHIEEMIVPYDRTPVKCVASLHQLIRDVRGQLSRITVPTLICQGGEDETVYPEDAYIIQAGIRSSDKELQWYPESSHIIVLDHEREKMFADIDAFINGQNRS